MTPRLNKTILIVSLTLNVFAIAGGVGLLVARDRIADRLEAQNRPPRGGGLMRALEALPEASREQTRQGLRDAALGARPDFEAARAARREAIDLADDEGFDADRIRLLLEQSRTAELRGRQRLEDDAVTLLGAMDAAERAALAPRLLSRHGRGRNDNRPAPPPPAD